MEISLQQTAVYQAARKGRKFFSQRSLFQWGVRYDGNDFRTRYVSQLHCTSGTVVRWA